jgi:heptosyltransferase-2
MVPPGGTLVIQPAHLGDAVLTLPLLTLLAERHGPVDVVTTPAALPLVSAQTAVRRAIPYDKHGRDRGLTALLGLGRRLRTERYVRAVLPHRSARSSALAWLAGVPERTGFAGSPGAMLYTRRVPFPTAGHMTNRLLALAGGADGRPVNTPWLQLTDADRAGATAWLAAHGVAEPFVVVAPGARWATKRWPGFAELAAALARPVVVVGGTDDGALAAEIAAAAPGRAHIAAGALGLRESAALVERAELVVSNDSLPLHLATALARPVVALFGPTVTAFGFGPLGRGDAVVEHEGLSCRPCSPHGPAVCPLVHHRCMREIPVARVLAAVESRLAGM